MAGVRVDAAGDLSPSRLSETGRREFRHLLRSHNLELTALGCPLRRGLDAAEDQQPRIEHVRKVMTLSYDLGPRVAIVEAGAVPGEGEEARGRLLTESLTALAAHGDRVGAVLALETGLESGEALNAYLARFDSGSLGANLDPANLLTHGFDVCAVGPRPESPYGARHRPRRPAGRRQPHRAGNRRWAMATSIGCYYSACWRRSSIAAG